MFSATNQKTICFNYVERCWCALRSRYNGPSNQIGGPILKEVYEDILVCMSLDGWSNVCKECSSTTQNSKSFLVNTSEEAESHTAEYFKNMAHILNLLAEDLEIPLATSNI